MNDMWKYSGVFLVALLMLFPIFASAATLAELQAQLQTLLAQVAALQAQQGNTATPSPASGGVASCPNLSRNLLFGSRGSDVIQLQQFQYMEQIRI